MLNDMLRVDISNQAQTSLPTVSDATLVDDTVALVDDATALVGGQTVTISVAKSRSRVDTPVAKVKIRH